VIEVKPFQGETAELVAVINTTWQAHYSGLKAIWRPHYENHDLEWQVLHAGPEHLPFRLAAYDGDRVIGCFLGQKHSFKVNGRMTNAVQGSFFSVLPEFSASPAAIKLINAMERQCKSHDVDFFLGYINYAKNSPAFHFWSKYARAFSSRFREVGPVDFWIRITNPKDFGGQLMRFSEKFALQCARLLSVLTPSKNEPHIRAFEDEDLSDCLKLLKTDENITFSQVWSENELRSQLSSERSAKTVVYQDGAGIGGFCNYYWTDYAYNERFRCAIIDLLEFGALKLKQRRSLLAAGTRSLSDAGATAVMIPAVSREYWWTFLSCGYVPIQSICHLVCLYPKEDLDFTGRRGTFKFR